jgi:hypothetical protein
MDILGLLKLLEGVVETVDQVDNFRRNRETLKGPQIRPRRPEKFENRSPGPTNSPEPTLLKIERRVSE